MKGEPFDIVAGRLPALACILAQKRDVFRAFVYRSSTGMEEFIGTLTPEKISWVEKNDLDKMMQGRPHQGIVLHVAPLSVLSLRDWLNKHNEPDCAILILDSITDPMNFGAIIRSAAAFGAGGVLFQKDRAAPVTPTVVKAAAGGVEYVDLIQATNLVRDIQHLKTEHFWIAALVADAPQCLWQADLKGKIAMIIGSEGAGIRPLVKKQSDFSVAVPIRGEMASLNASVCAGIALAEWTRQSQKDDSCIA